jgi:hypothetical protein
MNYSINRSSYKRLIDYSKIESKVQKFIIKSKFRSKNNSTSLINIKIRINIIKRRPSDINYNIFLPSIYSL